MLSKTLKELEDDGLVKRSEYLEVPIRVEYELTDKARQLQPILTDPSFSEGFIRSDGRWRTRKQNNSLYKTIAFPQHIRKKP